MILVTVGTQLPFDRLIRAMDDAAPSLTYPVFAQTGLSKYSPVNMEWGAFVEPREFEQRFCAAEIVVSHAGIGTVLMAQRHHKPLILYPRRAALKEHRNDHQMATVAALAGRAGIYIARDDAALRSLLQQKLEMPRTDWPDTCRAQLVDALSAFITGVDPA